jgi:Ca2+/Na+ antiporter
MKIGVAFSLPVALFGVCSVIGGQPQFALGAIFACSVAALTLVAGLLVCTSVIYFSADTRDWTRLLPTTAILLLAGFSGRLGLFHAVLLLVQGSLVLWLVRDQNSIALPEDAADSIDLPSPGWRFLSAVQALLALTILAAASWAAWKALADMQGKFSNVPGHSLAGLLIAPGIALSMLGTGMALAREGRAGTAISSLAIFVQINSCILLPVLICFAVIKNVLGIDGTIAQKLIGLIDTGNSMNLPIGIWRIDVVFLLFCTLMLLPAGWGRWRLGKMEGAILSFLYVIYLILITMIR